MSVFSQLKDRNKGGHRYPVAGQTKGRYLVGGSGRIGRLMVASDRRYLVLPTGQFIRLNPNGTPLIRQRNRRMKGAK